MDGTAAKCVMTSDPNCTLCPGMDLVLGGQRGPGFWPYIVTDFTTLQKRMMGVVVSKSRSKKESPVLLTFCPFCGERLLSEDGKPAHDTKESPDA